MTHDITEIFASLQHMASYLVTVSSVDCAQRNTKLFVRLKLRYASKRKSHNSVQKKKNTYF